MIFSLLSIFKMLTFGFLVAEALTGLIYHKKNASISSFKDLITLN